MNQQEIGRFLAEPGIAVMGTINQDGSPQLTPNWYYYDRNQLTFITTKERVKYFNRGGLVCLKSAARFDKWNRAAVR